MKVNLEVLREVILTNCLSLRQISEKTGVSPVSINKVLKGQDVSIKIIGKLAKGLDIPPSKLISVSDNNDLS